MKKRDSKDQVTQPSSLRIAFKNTGEFQRTKLTGQPEENTNNMKNNLPAEKVKSPDFIHHYLKPKRFDFF